MVVLNKIYTRTGDAGLTALGSGERVPKHSARIAAYGTVDETNAQIGVARLSVRETHPEVPAAFEAVVARCLAADDSAESAAALRTLHSPRPPARKVR